MIDSFLPLTAKASPKRKSPWDGADDDLANVPSAQSEAAPFATSAFTQPLTVVVAATGKLISAGGITLNLLYDAAALAAPASFRAGIELAATLLSQVVTDKITVNLQIHYSGSGGGASAGPDGGRWETYSSVRADLVSAARVGDATFNGLPNASSIQGQTQVAVWNAQLKLFGVLGANDTSSDDGEATFATDIDPSDLVGVALHELTHAMGRVPYGPQPDIFDLFRFTGAGTRLLSDALPSAASYFSIDNGATRLADFGQSSDPSDFLNSGVQGANDPFNEFYSFTTTQSLSGVDLEMLDALGYHVRHAPAANDFNGDGKSDILWRNAGGLVNEWSSNPSGSCASAIVGGADTSWQIVGGGDFNGDGKADILWRNANGDVHEWVSNASGALSDLAVGGADSSWQIAGAGDFNGDGKADILWRNSNGDVHEWVSNASGALSDLAIGGADATWRIAGVGDFNGDGKADILWRNNNGDVHEWVSNASGGLRDIVVGGADTSWQIAGVGDFNGDSRSDVLWRNSNGEVHEWVSNASGGLTDVAIGGADSSWQIADVGDFNGDGKADILWRNSGGLVNEWSSNASNGFTVAVVGGADLGWQIQKT